MEDDMTIKQSRWREELVEKYPAMFEGPGLRSSHAEVEDGWRVLVQTALGRLADILRERPGTSLVIDQIKSQFAHLRLYSHGNYMSDAETRERVELVVALACARSACTCEICGAEGRLFDRAGWLHTACDEHGEGKRVEVRPGFENLHVVRTLRDGHLRVVICRRYVRETDSFSDVDPASIGLDE
jgi:hypothetical protein